MNFRSPPSLSFAAAAVDIASSDSPQTVTVENYGNATLIFPIPVSGANPIIPENFALGSSEASACPLVQANASSVGTLAAVDSCQLAISYIPENETVFRGVLQLTDNDGNAAAPGYATQSIAVAARSGPPALVFAASGLALSTTYGAGAQICAGVQDASQDALPGITVNFSGAGMTFSPASAVTGSNGLACTSETGGAVGGFTAFATVPGQISDYHRSWLDRLNKLQV